MQFSSFHAKNLDVILGHLKKNMSLSSPRACDLASASLFIFIFYVLNFWKKKYEYKTQTEKMCLQRYKKSLKWPFLPPSPPATFQPTNKQFVLCSQYQYTLFFIRTRKFGLRLGVLNFDLYFSLKMFLICSYFGKVYSYRVTIWQYYYTARPTSLVK